MSFNVLIVDDSSVVRSVIGKVIMLCKVPIGEVYSAGNGKEALDIVASKQVDIIFADINMPVMNGLEMIDNLERDGLMQKIPVLVISTEGSDTRIDYLRSKGVRGYIRKPFTPEQIGRVFKEVLGA